ncbi:hypothetical protein HID58_073936 [Brassica napus]|uniref:Replication protein A 70 kDa DNA-binding subunit B/D first OB fold domain-containing protein n=1 Tax=Brassica napus TaxID=3708 RepID=A0ABQ7YFC7_BRANA|nr:hypothetical protein HID58_073936 [Brassica napus]
MDAMNFISDLKPKKSLWKIRVKVIRLWKQYSAAAGETIEMVFVDEKGDKIHASVRKELVSQQLLLDHSWSFSYPKFYVVMTYLCEELVGVGGIEYIEDEELAEIFGSTHKIQFYLVNIGFVRLRFEWDEDMFNILTTMRNWLNVVIFTNLICVTLLGGFKYIANTEGSQISFDDDIPEIQDFKSRSPSQPFLFNKIYNSRLHEIYTVKID